MGSAILEQYANKNKDNEIFILNRNLENSKLLAEKNNVRYLTDLTEIKNIKFDIFIIGVRPIDCAKLFESLDEIDISNSLIISMVNALSIESILNSFKNSLNLSVIRMIPNMNAIIGKSLTSYTTFGDNKTLLNCGLEILKSFGKVFEITEDKYPSFVTLTGTSPAYIFEFLKAFEQFGLENNYDHKFLKELIAEQIISTVENWKNNDKETEMLIKEICVPNGSTIAGYNVLLKEKFLETVMKCLNASKEKC